MSIELNTTFLKQQRYPDMLIPSPMPEQTPEVRIESPKRVIFLLGGEERWVIDESHFGGIPNLTVDDSIPDRIHVELNNAFFPGTNLSANLTCEVNYSNGNHVMDLSLDFGKIKSQVSLAEWLAGEHPVSSEWVEFDKDLICKLGKHGEVLLDGYAEMMEFFPGWVFRLKGRAIAWLHCLGATVKSDQIVLGMADRLHKSLFAVIPARRTLFSFHGLRGTSSLTPSITLPEGWQVEPPEFTNYLYDELHLETAVNGNGSKEQAFVAQPAQEDKKVWTFRLHGMPNPFLLFNVRYAMGFDESTMQAAQFGRFSTEPIWYHLSGCSLLLGDGQGSNFVLVARDKRIESAVVAPALLSFAAPLKGMIVEAIPARPFNVLGIYPAGIGRHPGFANTEALGLPALQIDPELPSPILAMSDLTISLLRPKDLLSLRVAFVNMSFRAGGGKHTHWEQVSANKPAYLIVYFPPQHIAEEAFPEGQSYPNPPVSVRMAGPSRLAFRVPRTVSELPYALETLLNWSSFEQSVVPSAMPSPVAPNLLLSHVTGYNLDETNPLLVPELPAQETEAPSVEHTAIEAPYRLVLSPNWFAGWRHAARPITHGGMTELWHTRLGVRTKDGVDEQETSLRTVRAVWCKDKDETNPFQMSLDEKDRKDIVINSSNHLEAIKVNNMMLSSLGAWLNIEGNWPYDPTSTLPNLSNWTHRAAMGRDNYVKTVREGYLFPFGHRAAKITVTERRCELSPSQEMVAYLVSWIIVVVREPERFYPAPGMPNEGRNFPYKRIRIKTLQTPHVQVTPWLQVDNQDLLFQLEGEDQGGKWTEFTHAFAFVEIKNDSSDDDLVKDLIAEYSPLRQQRSMDGQKVSFAPTHQPGDTEFVTNSLIFGAEITNELPKFYPLMSAADVKIPAVEQIAGADADGSDLDSNDKQLLFQYDDTYLQWGLENKDNNPGEVFFKLPSAVPKPFPGDKAGGIITPDLSIKGLSRTYGPVAENAITNCLDPGLILGEAKLLGGILLKEIVKAVNVSEFPGSIPQLTNRVIYPKVNGHEDRNKAPEAIETLYKLEPQMQSDADKIFEATKDTSMKLSALIYTKLTSPESTYDVTGELRNFKVNLIGTDQTTQFLTLHFSELTFKARSGQKPVVSPKIENVEFGGALQFVTSLQNFLRSVGEDSGIDVTPSGVSVSSSMAIPNVTLGILALQNLTFFTRFNLPFDGSPATFYFAFASRENPFVLTVGTFGGGGFFGIMLSLDKANPIKLLEASFEFGGNQALDLGVASGGIYLMAGIYYRMENVAPDRRICQLTGYVRCGGVLQVLGLVTVSAEFYLSLNYRDPGKAWGQATLTVKIHLLLTTKSVNLTVEKQFSGSDGDPLIEEMINEDEWYAYCSAFA